jgi:hypothetical protein
MIYFSKSVAAMGSPFFKETFKGEVESLDSQLLPLQQGLTLGSSVSDSKFSAMMISVSEEAEFIFAKAGIFYSSIIAGCNCADDPSPIDEQTEYCEVEFEINKETAEATVKLLS